MIDLLDKTSTSANDLMYMAPMPCVAPASLLGRPYVDALRNFLYLVESESCQRHSRSV
jgi:hypothetical protein